VSIITPRFISSSLLVNWDFWLARECSGKDLKDTNFNFFKRFLMKLSKVAFAVAGLAIASGSAFAGQIDSSSATLAREVIYSNAQIVRAPSKSYQFDGAIDARTNEQRLQLQWTLTGGLVWATSGNDIVGLNASPIALATTQQILKLTGLNAGGTAFAPVGQLASGLPTGSTVDAFSANSGTTLIFNITIPALAANLINSANFQINAGDFIATAGTGNVGVTNALAVAKETACIAPDTASNISFKHFTNHFGNGTVVGVSPVATQALFPDSEHFRTNSTNEGRLLNFTENLRFTFANGVQSQTDAATLRRTLLRTTAQSADYLAANTALGLPATIVSPSGIRLHRIATGIDLAKIASGLDLSYIQQYGNGANAVPFELADFDVDGTGNKNTGEIDLKDLVIEVKSPQGLAGWAAGSTVALLDSADVVIPGTVVTAPNASGVATITITGAAGAALFAAGTGARLYYVLPGNTEIPQNGVFDVTAKLNKDKTGSLQEQDNVCKAPLAGIGGGIKIDIRNYASTAKFPAGNYTSVVRLINNSESQTADVFAQMIYADGTYGPWGKMPTLLPRAVANYNSKELESYMTSVTAAAGTSGESTTGLPFSTYTRTACTNVIASPGAGVGDRVRFASNTGTTLRIQSYLVFPGGVLDVTNAQGVDFENNGDRVPTTAVDAQPVSQDAINGIQK
jgi:hypothetical protein